MLRPGGVIVEGTAGNTGIGLTVVAKALGYRTVIVIPDTQSQEKKDALSVLGAELIEVPAVPYKNPNNYVKVSGRLAEQLARTEPNGAIWANQFDNVANRDGHIRTTAQEIWTQTGGKVDGFVSSVGTGGTLAGVAVGLKAKNKAVKIALADPLGAALHSFYTDGRAQGRGQLDHRGHRAGPHHRQSRRVYARLLASRYRTRKRCRSSSIWCRRRACASAARPASTSPARSGWRGNSDPATPS